MNPHLAVEGFYNQWLVEYKLPWEPRLPSCLWDITHIIRAETFIFHGFGVQRCLGRIDFSKSHLQEKDPESTIQVQKLVAHFKFRTFPKCSGWRIEHYVVQEKNTYQYHSRAWIHDTSLTKCPKQCHKSPKYLEVWSIVSTSCSDTPHFCRFVKRCKKPPQISDSNLRPYHSNLRHIIPLKTDISTLKIDGWFIFDSYPNHKNILPCLFFFLRNKQTSENQQKKNTPRISPNQPPLPIHPKAWDWNHLCATGALIFRHQ